VSKSKGKKEKKKLKQKKTNQYSSDDEGEVEFYNCHSKISLQVKLSTKQEKWERQQISFPKRIC